MTRGWVTKPYHQTINAINGIESLIKASLEESKDKPNAELETDEHTPSNHAGRLCSLEDSEGRSDSYEPPTTATDHLLNRSSNTPTEKPLVKPAQHQNIITIENGNTQLVSRAKISENASSSFTLFNTRGKNTITAFYLNPLTKMLYVGTSDNMLHVQRTRILGNSKLLINHGKPQTFEVIHPKIEHTDTVTKIMSDASDTHVLLCFATQKGILVKTDRSDETVTLGVFDSERCEFIEHYKNIWEPIKYFEQLDETNVKQLKEIAESNVGEQESMSMAAPW